MAESPDRITVTNDALVKALADHGKALIELSMSLSTGFDVEVTYVKSEPATIANEQCDACADPGMTFDQAGDLDRGLALCTKHWNSWVLRWINSDDEPGVSAHLIQDQPVIEP